MVYTVELENYYEEVYFLISATTSADLINTLYDTSKSIADAFCMDIDEYNNIIINKIIAPAKYTIRNSKINKGFYSHKDLAFTMEKSRQFYIDKFKEVFAPQLMLLTIES